MSPRCLSDVFQMSLRCPRCLSDEMSPRCLPDVFQISSRCLPGVFQMSLRCLPDVSQISPRYLPDVCQMFLGCFQVVSKMSPRRLQTWMYINPKSIHKSYDINSTQPRPGPGLGLGRPIALDSRNSRPHSRNSGPEIREIKNHKLLKSSLECSPGVPRSADRSVSSS